MTQPQMTQPQNMVALDIGNKRRLERAALHKHIRSGDFHFSILEIAKALDGNPPACIASMHLEELLQWMKPHGGGQPAQKRRIIREAFHAAGCGETRLVRDLTARQRTMIVDTLTSFAYGRMAA